MPKNKKRSVQNITVVDYAIIEGVGAIAKHHPVFSPDYIAKHVDRRALEKKAKEVYMEAGRQHLPNAQKIEYVKTNLAKYIESGSAFDEIGKRIILGKGLEEAVENKGGWFSKIKRKFLGIDEPERSLDDKMEAMGELYDLFKSNPNSENLSEVSGAVTTLYEARLLGAAIDVLGYHGVVDKRKYGELKKLAREKTKESYGGVLHGIENYLKPQKVAAAVLGISSVGLLLTFGTKITGGVIGVAGNNETIATVLGGMFIVSSLVLFFKKI